jgi:hypothetical protein
MVVDTWPFIDRWILRDSGCLRCDLLFRPKRAMMPRLHRNNSAEWMMTIILWPIAAMMRLLRGSDKPTPSPKKSRQAMIEGLPPRTMN